MRLGLICLALVPILALYSANAELLLNEEESFYAEVEAKKPKSEHHSAPAPHHSAPSKPKSTAHHEAPKKPSSPKKAHTTPQKPHDPSKPSLPHRKPHVTHPKTPTTKKDPKKTAHPTHPKPHTPTKKDPKEHKKPVDLTKVDPKKHCSAVVRKSRKACAGHPGCHVLDYHGCLARLAKLRAAKEPKPKPPVKHHNPAPHHGPAPKPAPAPHHGGPSQPHRHGGPANNHPKPAPHPAPQPAPQPNPSGPTNGKTNDEGVELIKSFEGFVPNFYNDATGIKTIGYGHACHAHPCDQLHPPLTIEQGTQLLKEDLAGYEHCVFGFAPYLNSNQFSALVSFVYNLGCGALTDYDIGQAIKARNYPEAARLFGTFVKGGGRVLPGLVRRREAERVLFCKSGGC